jgi:hypothetical protein
MRGNPLVLFELFDGNQSRVLCDIGLVVGGPAAMACLAAETAPGISIGLTGWDRVFIAAIVVVTAHRVYEMSVMLRCRNSAAI